MCVCGVICISTASFTDELMNVFCNIVSIVALTNHWSTRELAGRTVARAGCIASLSTVFFNTRSIRACPWIKQLAVSRALPSTQQQHRQPVSNGVCLNESSTVSVATV